MNDQKTETIHYKWCSYFKWPKLRIFFSSGKNTILKNESNVFQFQHTYTFGIGYNVVSKYELNNNVLSGRIISEGGSAYFVYRLSDEPNPCE